MSEPQVTHTRTHRGLALLHQPEYYEAAAGPDVIMIAAYNAVQTVLVLVNDAESVSAACHPALIKISIQEARRLSLRPVDGIPWEIHEIEDDSARDAATVSFLAASVPTEGPDTPG